MTFALAIFLTAAGADVTAPPSVVLSALHAAAPSATRIAVLSYLPSIPAGCSFDGAEVVGGLSGSGRSVVRLMGSSRSGLACEGWATLEVRVYASMWVTRHAVQRGAPLANAVDKVEREVPRGGRILEAFGGTEVAAQTLPAGRVLQPELVRSPGPTTGDRISVVLRSGGLQIEQPGQLVSCSNGLSCARLTSGKQVEGVLVGRQLLVEVL